MASQRQPSQTQSHGGGKRRPRCPQCGSRKYRRDPGSSLIVCEEGHVLQGFRDEETQDDAGAASTNTRKRVVKREKRVKSKGTSHTMARAALSGPDGAHRNMQCGQLVFRHQLKAILNEWPELPTHMEAIARDIWSLYLQCHQELALTIEGGPTHRTEGHKRQRDKRASSAGSSRASSHATSRRTSRTVSRARSLSRGSSVLNGSDEEGPAEEEEDETLTDAELDFRARAREVSEGVDISDDEDDDTASAGTSTFPAEASQSQQRKALKQTFKGSWFDRSHPWPIVGITLCYLTLLICRVPILLGDLLRAIRMGRIPYLNILSILPKEMVSTLSEVYTARLFMQQNFPAVQDVYDHAHEIAGVLERQVHVVVPPLNAAPALWTCVHRLGMPPTVYVMTKALLALCRVDGRIHPPLKFKADGRLNRQQANGQSAYDGAEADVLAAGKSPSPRRYNAAEAPCLTLMAGVVLCLKLRYGLDGRLREEDRETHMQSGMPFLQDWLESIEKVERSYKASMAGVFDHDTDAIHITEVGERLDAYLDCAEKIIVYEDRPDTYQVLRTAEVKRGLEDLLSFSDPFEKNLSASVDARRAVQIRNELLSSLVTSLYNSEVPSQVDMSSQDDGTGSLAVQTVISSEEALREVEPPQHGMRPGEDYFVYDLPDRHTHYGTAVPDPFERTIRAAASAVGCQSDEMETVVMRLETKLAAEAVKLQKSGRT